MISHQQSNTLSAAPISVEAKLAAALAELELLKAPKSSSVKVAAKTYHSATPFIRFPIMCAPGHCESVQFIGGKLETTDSAVQAAVEAAIAAGGSGFSFAPIVGESEEQKRMRADVRKSAEIAQTKAVAAGIATA